MGRFGLRLTPGDVVECVLDHAQPGRNQQSARAQHVQGDVDAPRPTEVLPQHLPRPPQPPLRAHLAYHQGLGDLANGRVRHVLHHDGHAVRIGQLLQRVGDKPDKVVAPLEFRLAGLRRRFRGFRVRGLHGRLSAVTADVVLASRERDPRYPRREAVRLLQLT